jgi:ribonuclease HI
MTLVAVELWTDGSGRPDGPIGWAYVLRCRGVERAASGFVAAGTSNRAEMTAMLMGLRALKRPCRVTVCTDSEYLANPFRNGWIERWQARNWRKVKNVDLWHALVAAAAPHELTMRWVRGHTNIALNEECDQLAALARRAALRLTPVEATR